MATSTYEDVLNSAQELSPTDQLRLLEELEELAALIRRQAKPQPPRSILELQGLGKELWEGVDAQTYVDQERVSWTG